MRSTLDLLAKEGFTLSETKESFPMVILKEGKPIGFLLEDASLEMTANQQEAQQEIQKILDFSGEYGSLEAMENGEFKLTHYQDTVLSVAYSNESKQPIFSLWREKDGKLERQHTTQDKEEATGEFARLSGLVKTEELDQQQKGFQELLSRLTERNFSVEPTKEAGKTFYIFNKDHETVGYIGRDNKVTITTENKRTKEILTNVHQKPELKPLAIVLPDFIQRLRERLYEIGLTMRSMFSRSGTKHYINDQNQTVATIDEQQHLQFEKTITPQRMEQINKLVEEIQQERQSKQEQEQSTMVQDIPEAVQEQPVEVETVQWNEQQEAAEQENPVLSEAETQTLMTFLAVHLTNNKKVMQNPQIAPILTKLKTQAEKDGIIKPSQSNTLEQKLKAAKEKAQQQSQSIQPKEKQMQQEVS